MISSLLRRLDTMAGRTMALLLIGLGLFHLVSVWAYQSALDNDVRSNNETRIAERLLAIRRSLAMQTPDAREPLAHELSGGSFDAHYGTKALAVARANDADASSLRARLVAAEPDLDRAGVVIGSESAPTEGHDSHQHDPHQMIASLGLGDGTFVNVTITKATHVPGAAHATIWSTTLMALGVILASLVIVRWITSPLRALGEAAHAIGQGSSIGVVSMPETGPREVIETARAFNDMQRRIATLIEDRSLSLAAISHDLKTPLTRLRLQIEDVEAADARTRMIADISEMEQMIDATLTFIRGVPEDQPPRPYDVAAILESVCSDLADEGHPVELTAERGVVAMGHPLQIKRALTNLVQNAARHGGQPEVRMASSAEDIEIFISDTGPGIPPDRIREAQRPFARLDDARGSQPGGFGLGLAIADRLITAQGGTMTLANRSPRGLEVKVTLARSGASPWRTPSAQTTNGAKLV